MVHAFHYVENSHHKHMLSTCAIEKITTSKWQAIKLSVVKQMKKTENSLKPKRLGKDTRIFVHSR